MTPGHRQDVLSQGPGELNGEALGAVDGQRRQGTQQS